MRSPAPAEDVDRWLRAGGWFPGREDAAEADRLVQWRVDNSALQGFPLVPWDAAVHFVRSYASLDFPVPKSRDRVFRADPSFGYEGDAEDISELADNLGRRLFPVGYEAGENGIVLMDDSGRFFYLHHTGPYFLGANESQALSSLMTGDQDDAEDYFV
ncbi:SUKH-3 domain-containing protein [Streptomyces sp. NPDC088116]|uniref:SUKH-3 domain-containing protein n=1 Tax=Streptomyces sp. NPDC088116 TaxID=3365825 RepID=UPI0038088C34